MTGAEEGVIVGFMGEGGAADRANATGAGDTDGRR
jgi:hypothetical protein